MVIEGIVSGLANLACVGILNGVGTTVVNGNVLSAF